jgi:hypothetical protein
MYSRIRVETPVVALSWYSAMRLPAASKMLWIVTLYTVGQCCDPR